MGTLLAAKGLEMRRESRRLLWDHDRKRHLMVFPRSGEDETRRMEERRIEDHAQPRQILRLLRFEPMRTRVGQLQKVQGDCRSTESRTPSESPGSPGFEI